MSAHADVWSNRTGGSGADQGIRPTVEDEESKAPNRVFQLSLLTLVIYMASAVWLFKY
jgi:hypothetical protein